MYLAALPAVAEPGGDQQAGVVNALLPDATRNAQALAVKDPLQWNDLLQTNAKGRLRATLTDGSVLNLGSNGQLKVVQHDASSQQTSLDLNYGKLRNQVVKITQPGGKYEVKTPNAIIGVIGTDFYVSYEMGRTTVICYEGTLSVTPGEGSKIVNSNNSTTGATSSVTVLAGQMVVVGLKLETGGLSRYEVMARTSKEKTLVSTSHRTRGIVLIGMAAVAGLTVAMTQINSSSKPCGCK